jgi:asparagine synthase (glutamine-hydrolysing)
LLDRPKAGFAIPIDIWFQKELAYYFEQYLSKSYIEKQDIFCFQEVEKWLIAFRLGKKEYMTQLWNLLMFQLWYNHWIEHNHA